MNGELAADGNTGEYDVPPPAVQVVLAGDFGGGSVQLQRKSGDGTWRDIDGAVFSAATDSVIDFYHGSRIRGVLAGATAPDLYWEFY